MRSVTAREIPPAVDLTGRARILDAAIDAFSRNGFAGTTVRHIAAAAGVSPSLVMHHFDGKEGLRAECNNRALDFVRAKRSDTSVAVGTLLPQIGIYGLYLARMISEATDSGAELFTRLVDEMQEAIELGVADGSMRNLGDSQQLALVLTMQSLAPLLLHAQLARFSGEPQLSSDTLLSIAHPIARLYTSGLFLTSELTSAVETAARQ
jgi:TetR/AcrR family transcriptional regulator, regulator of cefoperazone and chloramphenicol sensitivity